MAAQTPFETGVRGGHFGFSKLGDANNLNQSVSGGSAGGGLNFNSHIVFVHYSQRQKYMRVLSLFSS